MKPCLLVIGDGLEESDIAYYKLLTPIYELHLAACATDLPAIKDVDTSRVFKPNQREHIEWLEQDFINACMLFIQIYTPEWVYVRKPSQLLSKNAMQKIVDHADLCGVKVAIHQDIVNQFSDFKFNFITNDENIMA